MTPRIKLSTDMAVEEAEPLPSEVLPGLAEEQRAVDFFSDKADEERSAI